MLCPSCGMAFDGRFCPNCGKEAQPFAFLCVRCGLPFNAPACPRCGTPLGGPAPGSGARAAGSVVWSMGLLAFLVLLALALAAFVYASWLIVDGALAAGPQTRLIPLYVLAPFPVGEVYDVSAGEFVAYFALIAAAIVAAYAWYGVRDARGTARDFLRPLEELGPRLESRSAWVATGQVFLASMFFQIVFVLLLAAGGFFPEPPVSLIKLPAWYPYFALANASVYEEVVARWLLIGLPLFLGGIVWGIASQKGVAPGRAIASAARHLVGGTVHRNSPLSLVVLAITLIAISSVMFGLAHVPDWGWWKFFPATVAGLGMGYLFVRRGLLAAILFHFATDYLAALVLMTGANLGALFALGLFVIVLAGLGSFFFIWYAVYIGRLMNHFALAWGFRRPRPVVAAPPPPPSPIAGVPATGQYPASPLAPPYGVGFAQFTCSRCGWREARYADGRFTCLRCGSTYP